jgi:hypothetical protein
METQVEASLLSAKRQLEEEKNNLSNCLCSLVLFLTNAAKGDTEYTSVKGRFWF